MPVLSTVLLGLSSGLFGSVMGWWAGYLRVSVRFCWGRGPVRVYRAFRWAWRTGVCFKKGVGRVAGCGDGSGQFSKEYFLRSIRVGLRGQLRRVKRSLSSKRGRVSGVRRCC